MSATIPFNGDIDLNKNQIKNGRFDNLSSAPGSPGVGQIYYNTTYNMNFIWNGTIWRPTGQPPLIQSNTLFTSANTNVDEVAFCLLLPGGLLTTNDYLDILAAISTLGTALKSWKLFVGTAAQTIGATQSGATQIGVAATSTSFKTSLFYRSLAIASNTSVIAPPATTNATGYTGGSTAGANAGITIPTLASDTYWIFTLQRASGSTDAFTSEFMRLQPLKS